MLALYRSGRQADALDAFQEARRVLMDELALEPVRSCGASGGDPRARPGDRASSPRTEAAWQRARSVDLVHRPRGGARQVVEHLREHRLVTLTGPPGVGKSRLALEAARSIESELRGGAWHVGLANAGSAADVVRLVTQALDARGPDPLARSSRAFVTPTRSSFSTPASTSSRRLRVVSAVLAECPSVRVLATSREVLHVVGEVRVIVDPLPLPELDGRDAADAPAVELFIARARARAPASS